MSKLPGTDKAFLHRKPHMQRCVASAREWKKSSTSGVGVRKAALIGWSQDRQSCVSHVKIFTEHFIGKQS